MIKEFLADENNIVTNNEWAVVRNRVECRDGFSMSVQASKFHCCYPRKNLFNGEFEAVEVMGDDELLDSYGGDPEYGVHFYVPLKVVDEVIKKHGGMKDAN